MSTLFFSPLAAPITPPFPTPPPPIPDLAQGGPTPGRAIPTGPVIDVSGARPEPPPGVPDGAAGSTASASQPTEENFDTLLRGLNPLHYVPVVGTIYRAITGENVPMPERIAISVVAGVFMGGPLGILGTLVGCLAEELWKVSTNPSGNGLADVKISAADLFTPPDCTNGSG